MFAPIAEYQTPYFSMTAVGLVGQDQKFYPGAIFRGSDKALAEIFEGHTITLSQNGVVTLDGEELGASIRLFNCPKREVIGRWVKSMIGTGALVLVIDYAAQ
ncbi:hypothetical protein [Delftia phage PhiW-14]|uniref:Uncharacterized protein n=1 Tax=Delftia phage PhiW-14 TaxID=665032 RepID=C9DG38_BPW14|nr:hypothetical protein DP-phiW-14_gp067 [Delftia phage PhiW-14]ACV50089.1 hypothetical protein [Delftia phage PhiW-14]